MYTENMLRTGVGIDLDMLRTGVDWCKTVSLELQLQVRVREVMVK